MISKNSVYSYFLFSFLILSNFVLSADGVGGAYSDPNFYFYRGANLNLTLIAFTILIFSVSQIGLNSMLEKLFISMTLM